MNGAGYPACRDTCRPRVRDFHSRSKPDEAERGLEHRETRAQTSEESRGFERQIVPVERVRSFTSLNSPVPTSHLVTHGTEPPSVNE